MAAKDKTRLSTGRRIKAATAYPYGKDTFGPPPPGSTKERTDGPKDELGKLGQFSSATTTSWNALVSDDEYVPELLWPRSIKVFNGMRNDPQVAGLLRGSTLPIRRYHWYLEPNGCDPKIVDMIAEDLGIPVAGKPENPRKRSQGRFRFDNHLRIALEMSMIYGHMYFEQVGQVDDDGYWRLRKLAERMPNTITEFGVDDKGQLSGIKQNFSGAPWIPINRMVAYVHDQEGGNWVGRSYLRSLYQPWLLKDRLLRVDVTRHERNGAGMPIVELPPGASRRQRQEAAALAQMYRVGQGAGGALPAGMKLTLLGVQGNVSDTLASIRFHNEEMSRSWLMMFMQLGQTESGSRALGAEFLDFFAMAQESLAIWARDIINEYMVEDWIDWNVGADSAVPLIRFRRTQANHLSAETLANLVHYGAIQLDTDLEAHLREFYGLPAPGGTPIYTSTRDGTVAPVAPAGQQAPQPQLPAPKPATVSSSSSHPGQAHTHAASLPPGSVEAAASASGDGSWPYRRQPTTQELAAATDFPALDAQWETATQRIIKKWNAVTAAQIEELVQQIEAATTPAALQDIFATPGGTSMLTDEMIKLIDKGAALAEEEAKRQGFDISANTVVKDTEKIVAEQRAANIDRLLADALKQSALAKANSVSPTGGGGPDVAAKVERHLLSLKGVFVRDQLGGAMTAAQNAGRRAVFEAAPESVKLYASEILDANTCGPCFAEDGKEFGTLAAAQSEYSSGGYDSCEGGPKCRGTIVAVYGEAE